MGASQQPLRSPSWRCEAMPNNDVAFDRAGMTAFRDITFLVAGPASERSRSHGKEDETS